MRSNLKLILFSLIGLVLLVQFTNCAEFDQGAADLSSSLCDSGGLCEGVQEGALSLTLADRTVLSEMSESNNSILISGKCTTGNFNTHIIKIDYRKNSERQVNELPFANACQNGKFYIQLQVEGAGLVSQDRVYVRAKIVGLQNGSEIIGPGLSSSKSYNLP